MYHLKKFCCICMNTSDLKHLFEADSDGVSHYNKLTSSIAEMNFKEMNDQRLICAECCVTLNTVYDFRQLCLRSKTNLISQLQTSDHTSGTVRVCLKDIKPELIVVKNRGGSEKEGSNCLEGRNPQIKFKTESYKKNIDFSGSVKGECESEDDGSSAHEDAIVDHVNEGAHSDVKMDVEHHTMKDCSEYYTDFNKIEIEEHQLEGVKEEPMSDTETPQDGSTSLADTRTSEEPKKSEETIVGNELTRNTDRGNEGLHQCEICQESFNQKDSLMHHIQTHSSKKSYECEICKKSYSSMSNLTKHMVTHTNERPYKCEICKKSFRLKGILTDHMRRHNGETPFKCEICNKGFIRKGALIFHMLIHSNEKSYECVICKKRFNNKWNLNAHMKTHSNDRPYECEICKKGFKHKDKVIRHMKTHSSERPYECEICKKGFKHKDKLTRHIKTHSSERPYECEICKMGSNSKSSLTGHMEMH